MFLEITLKNYRTHKSTTIELHPVTLLIGNNNSGKTNFLAGIQDFCELVRNAPPDQEAQALVDPDLYFLHRYRLAKDDETMGICMKWSCPYGEVDYEMEVYKNRNLRWTIGCKEKIQVKLADTHQIKCVSSGYEQPSDQVVLRKQIETSPNLQEAEKSLCRAFFYNFESTFSYHFQPLFLKGLADSHAGPHQVLANGREIPSALGREGQYFHAQLHDVKENREHIYTRFVALMRRYERTFHGIRYEHQPNQYIWEFDLNRTDRIVESFASEVVSEGLMKAAAIALLVALDKPPALIMLEEIENGINPGNIQQLMYWIWQTTSLNEEGHAPQFILTSHSPSVLREFHAHLNHVYTFRLDKRRFQSDVRNLSDALDMLVGVGTVEGEIEEENGRRVVKIPKHQLPELWYSGTIG